MNPYPQQQMQPPEYNNTTMQPIASLQLRQNIHSHLAQVWECLQIIQNTSVSEDDVAAQTKKKHANEWLMTFKYSLPPEGHEYMMQVVRLMIEEHKAGRKPLSFLKSGDTG